MTPERLAMTVTVPFNGALAASKLMFMPRLLFNTEIDVATAL